MTIDVGVSQLPGRTFGRMQEMTNVQAGLNLRAAIFELKRDYGLVATVNEADRPRPDQLAMRAAWLAYKAGRGPWAPLAAYCMDPPKPGTYTSTHDPINYGNGADLGGPGGSVLGGTRAHNLLDGDHPDGVLGRKYGIFNTGKHFSTPESWHFNIYPARAQKLATLADSTAPAPTPDPVKDDFDMSIISVEWTDDKNPVARTAFGRWPIVNSTIPGSGYPNDLVQTPVILDLILAQRAADPTEKYSIKTNGAQRNIVDFVYRQCQNQFRKDVASEVISALKTQGVIK